MGPHANAEPTATEREPATLLVSFELSRKNWVLTIPHPGSGKLSRVAVPPCDTGQVLDVLISLGSGPSSPYRFAMAAGLREPSAATARRPARPGHRD